MAVLKVILVGAASLPDPLNIAMETAAFTGNKHKIYLEPNTQLIPNGGGNDTTDWINPTSGLAQYWLEVKGGT